MVARKEQDIGQVGVDHREKVTVVSNSEIVFTWKEVKEVKVRSYCWLFVAVGYKWVVIEFVGTRSYLHDSAKQQVRQHR
jgi:hypothetical protein